jgi:hypothetical protein
MKGMGYDVYGSMKMFRGMHRDQHGFPEMIVDYLLERGLDHVWSIP